MTLKDQDDKNSSSQAKRLVISPDVVVQRLGEQLVLINLRTDRIYELNNTGGRFFELVSSGLNREQIQQQMLSEFAVDEADLALEIDQLIVALAAEGLAQVSDDQ